MENEEGPASKKRKMSPSISNGNNSNESLATTATATAGAGRSSTSPLDDTASTMAGSKRRLSTLPPDALIAGEQLQHPSSHESKSLSTFTSSLATMRALITCKICDRLLYEPYVLACGHTYCYSCLSEWLSQPAQGRTGTKRSCPDCRAEVKQQPAPNFVVREMTSTFFSRQELLSLEGSDETKEQHEQWAREEGEIIAKDREKGMLFKGIFSRRRRLPRLPIVDPEDGVERCPDCHWELEDGFCNHCGLPIDDLLAYEDSELGGFEPAEEDWYGHDDFSIDFNENPLERSPGAPGEMVRELFGRRTRRPPLFVSVDTSDDEDDEDDEGEEEDPTMDGFVQDDRISYESGSDGNGLPSDEDSYSSSPRRVRRRPPIVIDDEDEDESDNDGTAPPVPRNTVVIDESSDEDSSDEDEDEDEVPARSHRAQQGRQRIKRSSRGNVTSRPANPIRRRPAPVTIDSDSDSDDSGSESATTVPQRSNIPPSDDSDDESNEDMEGATLRGQAWGGFSPPEPSSSAEDDRRSQSYDINQDDDAENDDDNRNDRFYLNFETRIGGRPNDASGNGYDSSSTYGGHATDDVDVGYHHNVPVGYGADGESDEDGAGDRGYGVYDDEGDDDGY
ncbi:hypothetical protein K431DRAFT_280953 [Polychaeton citri CBS 116435]|uniref:RING-type domain-containing protein n=1 Tax=Polychaeton citri CBS 116435 TaxID=1314669 RepID=A0A9P4UT10_9PEZI|nr:hypothetical protein K431DRAFT_280953 [Polychaeton citri CBS 116435]